MTTMYGLTRGMSTLIGAAAAGALLWVGTLVAGESLGAYWAFVGLIAAAGLVMALSQLLGGWTKWGMPTMSTTVLLLGFLPVLIAGGIVLLAAQPQGTAGTGLGETIGLGWLVGDLTAVFPAIAFAIGLTFGFSFDTLGPRRDEDVVETDRHVHDGTADAPTTAERRHVATGEPHVVPVGPAHDDELVGARTPHDGTARRRAETPSDEPEHQRRRPFDR